MGWKGTVIALLLAFLPFASFSQTKGHAPFRNIDRLNALLDSTLATLAEQGVIDAQDTLTLIVESADSAFSQYQKSYLQTRLLNRYGVSLLLVPRKEGNSGKTLTLRWLNWQIEYRPVRAFLGLKKRGIQRNIVADFFVEVLGNSTARLLYSRQITATYEEQLRKASVKALEQPGLKFLRGRVIHQKNRMAVWLEPVFLFAISGTVIYLFYAVRTQ